MAERADLRGLGSTFVGVPLWDLWQVTQPLPTSTFSCTMRRVDSPCLECLNPLALRLAFTCYSRYYYTDPNTGGSHSVLSAHGAFH